MSSLALADTGRFDILTLFDRGDRPPAWADQLFNASPTRTDIEIGYRRGANRNVWATQLDEAVRSAERPVLLVAHGVSCLALAWWARLSPAPYVERVSAALLVRPLGGLTLRSPRDFAAPKTRLPFPSVVIDRNVDDRAAAEQARDFAAACGSRFDDDEEQAVSREGIFRRVTAMIVEHEVRVALRRAHETRL